MTEPKVEAGDRALARKCVEAVLLDTLGEARLDELDEPLIDDIAALIQSAMNAQERELREALSKAAHVCRQATTFSSPAWKRNALSVIVRAERLLAERGGKQ